MFTPGRTRPDPSALRALSAELARFADATEAVGPWRSGSFAALARAGVLAGFVPADCGGTEAAEPALLEALAAIAERCLTTALAVSQWLHAATLVLLAALPATVPDLGLVFWLALAAIAALLAWERGASVLRVHDVAATVDALRVAAATLGAR